MYTFTEQVATTRNRINNKALTKVPHHPLRHTLKFNEPAYCNLSNLMEIACYFVPYTVMAFYAPTPKKNPFAKLTFNSTL